MKKWLAILLSLALVLPICGCKKEPVYQSPVTFYYQSTELRYDAECTVVGSEVLEGASYATLEDTLAAYFSGPVSQELSNPFPTGLYLISSHQRGKTLYLTFSNELATLNGWTLTLACCCITLTCLDLTDATEVCIAAKSELLNGEKNITMNRECLVLIDSSQQTQDK